MTIYVTKLNRKPGTTPFVEPVIPKGINTVQADGRKTLGRIIQDVPVNWPHCVVWEGQTEPPAPRVRVITVVGPYVEEEVRNCVIKAVCDGAIDPKMIG